MLITFSCKAYENITMLGDTAKHMLSIMGHSGTVPGAIVAEDIPEALSRLESTVKQKGHTISPDTEQSDDEDEKEQKINLAQRSFPLINMLKAAQKHHCNVMWDYY